MYIDTAIAPTKYLWYARCGFVGLVAILVYWADLSWWQMGLMAGVAVFCVWQDWINDVPLCELSTKDPDELWDLGVFVDDRQVWQAYLNNAHLVDFGFGQAVRLSFYVVEPHKQPLTTWVFYDSVPKTTFCKLAAQANFGGY